MEPILSKKEQERQERNASIMHDYCTMLQDFPDTKPWRIVRTVADKHGLSPEQVRYILISMGAYVTNDVEQVEQD